MMTTSTTDQFSAHYLERLQYNWVDFLFTNSIASFWHQLSFMSYLRGLFLNSFQTTKGTPTMITISTCQVSTSGLPCRRDRLLIFF